MLALLIGGLRRTWEEVVFTSLDPMLETVSGFASLRSVGGVLDR